MLVRISPVPAAGVGNSVGRSGVSGGAQRGAGGLVVLLALLVLVAGGCAGGPPAAAGDTDAKIAALERDILALGPEVDPEEAARAARVAVEYPLLLAKQYGVTDSPLIHNTKVNLKMRPRGLCWHWAEDMENRLAEEAFETLDLHRAIATPLQPFGGDHSTVIVSRRGDTMYDGLVLDPWRGGGVLHWARTPEDKYAWRPQVVVHNEKRLRRLRDRRPNLR